MTAAFSANVLRGVPATVQVRGHFDGRSCSLRFPADSGLAAIRQPTSPGALCVEDQEFPVGLPPLKEDRSAAG
jgi:hypothetical protein